MSNNIEIIIGTYEEFLLGYRFNEKEKTLTQSFADRSHTGALKCCAVEGKFIASGGTDDRIFVYDMKKRKQNQIILNHEGTVNAITFTVENKHLLSGGDDGKMFAVNLDNWSVEGSWKKAHNGLAVTHISCHPSGKLALTLGRDLSLRTWNLIKGRIAYKTNLKSRSSLGQFPDCLAWSPNGEYFILCGPRIIEIWSIKKADVWISENTSSKPICVVWANDTMIYVGLENGKILLMYIDQIEKSITFDAHISRIKAICSHNDLIISACSSGEIKVWKLNSFDKKLEIIISTNIGCRPTCMGVLDLDQFGSDYVLNKNLVEKIEDISTVNQDKILPQKRTGIVMVEYENDENNSKSSDENQNSISESDKSENNERHKTTSVKAKKPKLSSITKDEKDKRNKRRISKGNKMDKSKQPGAFVRLHKS